MKPPTYSELRERYAGMSTEDLVQLAVTSDLTDEAILAMDAELEARKGELQGRQFRIVDPVPPEPPLRKRLWAHALLLGLTLGGPFLPGAWDNLKELWNHFFP